MLNDVVWKKFILIRGCILIKNINLSGLRYLYLNMNNIEKVKVEYY